MTRLRLSVLLLLPALLALGCDNVGRAFDPDVNPNEPGETPGVSPIQVVPVGGQVREGRPRVREAYPEGAGWPGVVPIVVEFSESVNAASILPTTPTGIDGRIGLRVQGTTQLLPCATELVAGGRLLIMRPVAELTSNASQSYEVVMFADGRVVDGVRFQVSGGETVLSEFQVNQDPSITDGRILAVFPRDNTTEQAREADVWVVFDRPANAGTIVEANMLLRPQGGSALAVDLELPVMPVGAADGRVVRLHPTSPLSAATRHELVVNDQITFGQDGNLDFRGRVPFSVFTAVAPAAPTRVELGNGTAGFPNKINVGTALNAMLHVRTPADTLAGDRVLARIYGGDAATEQAGDFVYFERTATAPGNGEQDLMLDFGGALGSLAVPMVASSRGPVW
jgi:hypothetical protein